VNGSDVDATLPEGWNDYFATLESFIPSVQGPFWQDSGSGTCRVTATAETDGSGLRVDGWLGKNNDRSFMVFRKEFPVPASVPAGANLYLRTKQADDVMVYLNNANITNSIVASGGLEGLHTSVSNKSSGGANTGGRPEKHETTGLDTWVFGDDIQQHQGCPPPDPDAWDVTYSGPVLTGTTNTLYVVVANRDGKVSYFDAIGVIQ
jgi:hypothetical protein